MYKPVNFTAQLFRAYLAFKDHPGKIRIQNWLGRNVFSNGILFKNEEGVVFNLSANDWITRIFLLEGNYENKSVELSDNILRNSSVFIDIGANFGLYTCQINANNKNLQTIAVDANYKILPTLIENIRLNSCGKRISVFNVALSDAQGFVTLEQPALDNMGTTQTKHGEKGFLNVGCCSLAQLLDENGITKVSLIKIDIEGNEFSVFKDFDFDKYQIENILMEFNHLSEVSLGTLLDFFQNKNFMSYKIDGSLLKKEDKEIPENNIWLKRNGS